MSRCLGIDPGKQGALALIDSRTNRPHLADIPTIMSGGKRRYDVDGMWAILRRFQRGIGPLHAILEHSQAMPKQGVTSTFSIGEGFGIWQGLLVGMGISYTLVRPAQWKRDMLSGMARDKGASVLRAKQLYPSCAKELTRVKDHNRAEAILLAAWGLRKLP